MTTAKHVLNGEVAVDATAGYPSGPNLTFESWEGFPPDSTHASLAYAKRNFHHSQAR